MFKALRKQKTSTNYKTSFTYSLLKYILETTVRLTTAFSTRACYEDNLNILLL